MGDVVTLSKPKRPFGVWLTTAVNTLLAIILLATSFKGGEWGVPTPQVAAWAILGLAIWFSALSTWWGSRRGRNVMLVLITLYLVLLLVQTFQIMFWVQDWATNTEYMPRYIARTVGVILWLIANYWLLLGKRGPAFFA